MFGEFELEIPGRLKDALAQLEGGTALAGGTNLMVELRARTVRPARVISLDRLDELRRISVDGDRITLGSRVTVADILASSEIATFAPALVQAAGLFAGQMVRNMATIGGNIACASPAADLVPPLMSLDAEVTLASVNGTRQVPLAQYFTGYKRDVRAPGELITQISWHRPPDASVNSFYKLARRKGDAITVTGVAILLAVKSGKCSRARIALGAVAPSVIRAPKAEALLEGQPASDALFAAAARQAGDECSPIDDVRASAGYRQNMVETLTRRLLAEARDRLVGERIPA